jgi:hypothetical protein
MSKASLKWEQIKWNRFINCYKEAVERNMIPLDELKIVETNLIELLKLVEERKEMFSKKEFGIIQSRVRL